MASSDDIKNSLDNIADKLSDLSTDLQNTKTVLDDISNHLIVSNMAHARNARASDILWKLQANSTQLQSIKTSNDNMKAGQNAVQKVVT